jgi:hypothetical protein
MTGEKPDKSSRPAAKEARSERLAAALRDNLKRRKAQARGRASSGSATGDAKISKPKKRPE